MARRPTLHPSKSCRRRHPGADWQLRLRSPAAACVHRTRLAVEPSSAATVISSVKSRDGLPVAVILQQSPKRKQQWHLTGLQDGRPIVDLQVGQG